MNSNISHVLSSLFLIVSYTADAQYFNKVFDFDNGLEYSVSIKIIGENYIISSGGSDSSGNEKLGYLIVDNKGRELLKKVYSNQGKAIRNGKMVKLRDGNLADFRTVQYRDSSNALRSYSWLIKLNTQADTVWTKSYSDTTVHNFFSRTLIETPDSGYLLICDRNRHPDYDPIVIRTDKNGKELWRKAINTPVREVAIVIVHHPNGDYYLGGFGNTGGVYKSWVVRMDDSANVKFQRKYSMTGGQIATLTVLKDSNLIFGTDTFIYKNRNDYFKKQIIKIEPNSGNVIWRQIHDSTMQSAVYNKVIEGDSSELYVIGRHTNDDIWTSYTLTRMTFSGDTVWKHNYMYERVDDENYLWDFIRTSDKGFIFCGDVSPNNSNQDVWVLKVDSNGCMSPECKSRVYDLRLGIDYSKALGIKINVFPNPVVSEIYVDFEQMQNIAWNYSLVDQKGSVVKNGALNADKSSINMESLPSGVYLLQLESELGYRVFRIVKD